MEHGLSCLDERAIHSLGLAILLRGFRSGEIVELSLILESLNELVEKVLLPRNLYA